MSATSDSKSAATARWSFAVQSVVVSGGTRGIGKAIALAFLDAGAKVHVTWRSDEAAASAFARNSRVIGESRGIGDSRALGDRVELHQFDVADYTAVERFWTTLAAREASYIHGATLEISGGS